MDDVPFYTNVPVDTTVITPGQMFIRAFGVTFFLVLFSICIFAFSTLTVGHLVMGSIYALVVSSVFGWCAFTITESQNKDHVQFKTSNSTESFEVPSPLRTPPVYEYNYPPATSKPLAKSIAPGFATKLHQSMSAYLPDSFLDRNSYNKPIIVSQEQQV